MNTPAPKRTNVTIEEWLAMDFGDTRTELIFGEVLPRHCDSWSDDPQMMATTRGHTKLCARIRDLFVTMLNQQNNTRCDAYEAGPIVAIDHPDIPLGFEPDVFIECNPDESDDSMFISPCVVVEVLSPSTAYRDLAIKAKHYFLYQSIQHYLIVDPKQKVLLHYTSSTDFVRYETPDACIALDPPGIEFVLGDVFSFDSTNTQNTEHQA